MRCRHKKRNPLYYYR